jgi:hypothetical protein
MWVHFRRKYVCVYIERMGKKGGERRVERGKRAILKGREGCKEYYIDMER